MASRLINETRHRCIPQILQLIAHMNVLDDRLVVDCHCLFELDLVLEEISVACNLFNV